MLLRYAEIRLMRNGHAKQDLLDMAPPLDDSEAMMKSRSVQVKLWDIEFGGERLRAILIELNYQQDLLLAPQDLWRPLLYPDEVNRNIAIERPPRAQ